jgi:hypothetical protein
MSYDEKITEERADELYRYSDEGRRGRIEVVSDSVNRGEEEETGEGEDFAMVVTIATALDQTRERLLIK